MLRDGRDHLAHHARVGIVVRQGGGLIVEHGQQRIREGDLDGPAGATPGEIRADAAQGFMRRLSVD